VAMTIDHKAFAFADILGEGKPGKARECCV
jgi:hypothetical protein